MQPDTDVRALDAAIAWMLRLRSGDGDDWAAFTLWLEADPAHAAAYDAVSLADADLDRLLLPSQAPLAANDDDAPVRRRFGRWVAGATVAAAVAAGAAILIPHPTPSLREIVATAPGEHREIALIDGSRIALNGGTTLMLDRAEPRRVELRAGEALFTVRHRPGNPFTVVAGTDRVVDVGTTFDVVRDTGQLRIAVAEGSVRFNPGAENVGLTPGNVLTRIPDGRLILTRSDPAAAGSWRQGRLVFDNRPLTEVVADLTRSTGLLVSVDPAIARRGFSGTVLLDAVPALTIARVAGLAKVTARPEGRGWRLIPNQRIRR